MSPKDDQPGFGGFDPRELCYPVPFAELMALDPLGVSSQQQSADAEPERVERFRSRAVPFPPGDGTMAFGGHVYAQSAYAASQTVDKGFIIHNVTGTFTRPGLLGMPFIYTVRCIRDGKLYCTRAVDVRQNGMICFSCLCSFKSKEGEPTLNHQPPAAQQRYKSILDNKRPEDHPVSPSVDAQWWVQHVQEGSITEREFPGANVRKVDMMGNNDTEDVRQNPEKYRQLQFYSMKGSPEYPLSSRSAFELMAKDQSGEYDNLYACAHMYASDKNSVLLIPRALGNTNFTSIASLSFTFILHQHGEALRMIDWNESSTQGSLESAQNKWFVQEAWTPRSGENRAVYESWLWSPEGKLLATTLQDSLLRFPSEKL